jgi:hypothetical protein
VAEVLVIGPGRPSRPQTRLSLLLWEERYAEAAE